MTHRPYPQAVADGRVRPVASRSRSGRVTPSRRRRRRLAGLTRFAVFLLLIFIAVWAGLRGAHAGDDPAVYSGTAYTVRAGDDLWTIAESQYGAEMDLRAAVYAIREANGLESAGLMPGQALTLPYLEE
ncbi:MAG: LysM peptidoglycan-binding domain-containing protein [Acidobacteriota bacterium]|nr:LysM peptidoglycan-binding domain-containing protein [Acidobacteriota bacterium]